LKKSLNELFLILTGGQIVTLHKEYLYVNDIVDGIKDECKFDSSKPSAIPQKLFDVAKLNNIGWKVKVGIDASESYI